MSFNPFSPFGRYSFSSPIRSDSPSPPRKECDEPPIESAANSILNNNDSLDQNERENETWIDNRTMTPLRLSSSDDEQVNSTDFWSTTDFSNDSFDSNSDLALSPQPQRILPGVQPSPALFSRTQSQSSGLLFGNSHENDLEDELEENFSFSGNRQGSLPLLSKKPSIESTSFLSSDSDHVEEGFMDGLKGAAKDIPDAASLTLMFFSRGRSGSRILRPRAPTSASSRANPSSRSTQTSQPKNSEKGAKEIREESKRKNTLPEENVNKPNKDKGIKKSTASGPTKSQGGKIGKKVKTERHHSKVERESHLGVENEKSNFVARMNKAFKEYLHKNENEILGKKKVGDINNYEDFEARFLRVFAREIVKSPSTAVDLLVTAMVRKQKFLKGVESSGIPIHLAEGVAKLIVTASMSTLVDLANYDGVTNPRETEQNLPEIWNKQLEARAVHAFNERFDKIANEKNKEFLIATKPMAMEIQTILQNESLDENLRGQLKQRLVERGRVMGNINAGFPKDNLIDSITDKKKEEKLKSISNILSDSFIKNLTVNSVKKLIGVQTMVTDKLVGGIVTGVVETMLGNGEVTPKEVEEFLRKQEESNVADPDERELMLKIGHEIAHALIKNMPDDDLADAIEGMIPWVRAGAILSDSEEMKKAVEQLVEESENAISEDLKHWTFATKLQIEEANHQLQKQQNERKSQGFQNSKPGESSTDDIAEEYSGRSINGLAQLVRSVSSNFVPWLAQE
ncbi:MAG: hypothetical protein AAGG81_05420 [Chlamydiota bacterium]